MYSTEQYIYSHEPSHSALWNDYIRQGSRFKAGEIKVKTRQTAEGVDDSTLLTWQVLSPSDSSELRKITTKESLVIII